MCGASFADELPETLLGRWETEIGNCSHLSPSRGQGLSFETDRFEFIDHATEGKTCGITNVQTIDGRPTIQANCQWEESEARPEVFSASESADGRAIVFDGTKFERCSIAPGPTASYIESTQDVFVACVVGKAIVRMHAGMTINDAAGDAWRSCVEQGLGVNLELTDWRLHQIIYGTLALIDDDGRG